MQAINWDKGSLLNFKSFSFPTSLPYETVTQPVLFILGDKDSSMLNKGARLVIAVVPSMVAAANARCSCRPWVKWQVKEASC